VRADSMYIECGTGDGYYVCLELYILSFHVYMNSVTYSTQQYYQQMGGNLKRERERERESERVHEYIYIYI